MSIQILKSPNPSILAINVGVTPPCMADFSRVSLNSNGFHASDLAQYIVSKDGLSLQTLNHFDLINQGDELQVSLGLKTFQWNGFTGARAIEKVMGTLKTFDMNQIISPNVVKAEFTRLNELNTQSLTTQIVLDVLKRPEIQNKLAEDGGALIIDNVEYNSETNRFMAHLVSVGSCSGCTKAKPETLKNIQTLIETALDSYRENAPDGHPMKTVQFDGINEKEMKSSFFQLKAEMK